PLAKLCWGLRDRAVFWFVGHKAPLLLDNKAEALTDRARHVLSTLREHLIGTRRTVVVAHSLGGLLVKSLLSLSDTSPKQTEKDVVDHTHTVMFVGTPHKGSYLSRLRHLTPVLRSLARACAKSLSVFGLGLVAAIGFAVA